eukprot:scaffold90009_cov48-Phaeocystis_antarctica.AAC.2
MEPSGQHGRSDGRGRCIALDALERFVEERLDLDPTRQWHCIDPRPRPEGSRSLAGLDVGALHEHRPRSQEAWLLRGGADAVIGWAPRLVLVAWG